MSFTVVYDACVLYPLRCHDEHLVQRGARTLYCQPAPSPRLSTTVRERDTRAVSVRMRVDQDVDRQALAAMCGAGGSTRKRLDFMSQLRGAQTAGLLL